jgi:hypothetical protein
MTKEEVFKIYHIDEEVENTFRPRGIYAHGYLEDDMRFDIIRISNDFKKHINEDGYPKVGEYKCSWRGCLCTLIVKPEFPEAITTNCGLVCYEDDVKSLEEIRRNFTELI